MPIIICAKSTPKRGRNELHWIWGTCPTSILCTNHKNLNVCRKHTSFQLFILRVFYPVDKHSDEQLIRGWPGEKLLVAKRSRNWLHQAHSRIALNWPLSHWDTQPGRAPYNFTAKMCCLSWAVNCNVIQSFRIGWCNHLKRIWYSQAPILAG